MGGEGQWVGKCGITSTLGERGGGVWIPRLAQADVCDAIVVAEGYVEVAVSVQRAAVEADVLLEGLEEKGALVDGGFCFARHGKNSNTNALVDT